MALRATPTIAICLTAGIAGGIALSRPADQPPPAAAAPVTADAVAPEAAPAAEPVSDSPYLADAEAPAVGSAEPAPAPVAEAAPTAIAIEGFAFSATSSVAAGSPIAVTNFDSAAHTLTANDGAFDTGTLGQNELATLTAPGAPGTYAFFCEIHPSMTGQLVVS